MRSVWAIETPKTIEKKFGKHPTQKPEDLLKRIVLASTNNGDLIINPFTGTGGINPRTGIPRPKTRAFYARTCLVKKIFETAS